MFFSNSQSKIHANHLFETKCHLVEFPVEFSPISINLIHFDPMVKGTQYDHQGVTPLERPILLQHTLLCKNNPETPNNASSNCSTLLPHGITKLSVADLMDNNNIVHMRGWVGHLHASSCTWLKPSPIS